MAWAWHYSQAVNERADGWECVCERVKAPSQAAQTRAESCFRFVCLSVCHGLCRFREDSLQAFFNFYFLVSLSLTPSGRRLGRGRTQRRRSVAGRSANQRTTGTGTKETKDARQKGKEAEREGAAAGVGAPPIHSLCVQVQVQVQVRDQVRQNRCVW
jgi:hypothetical protein